MKKKLSLNETNLKKKKRNNEQLVGVIVAFLLNNLYKYYNYLQPSHPYSLMNTIWCFLSFFILFFISFKRYCFMLFFKEIKNTNGSRKKANDANQATFFLPLVHPSFFLSFFLVLISDQHKTRRWKCVHLYSSSLKIFFLVFTLVISFLISFLGKRLVSAQVWKLVFRLLR